MSRIERRKKRIMKVLDKALKLVRKYCKESEYVGNIKSYIFQASRKVDNLEYYRFREK